MLYLYGSAFICLVASFVANKNKTIKALKSACKMFFKVLPLLLITLILISFILFLLPDYVIANYLGNNNVMIGSMLAALIGSISLLPGFITFPLCGLLLKQGVSYTVLAAFTTSLMMVGIVTFPMEKKYFGTKLTIIRNISSFIIAIIVSLVIGIIYGEVI